MSLGFSINVRVGLWLDDLKMGVKEGLNAALPLKPEAAGLDAFSSAINARELGESGRRDLAHFIRSRGVALVAFRADVGGRRLADSKYLDANLTRLKEALDLAESCGAEHLVVPAGFVPAADDKNEAVARTTLSEAARSLAAWTSHTRVRIAWQAGSENPETLAAFLAEIDNAGIFELDLNPGGLVMRAHDPLKALNALGSRVGIVSALDHFRGGGEAVFGLGDVRWGEVFVGLSGLQRRTPFNVLAGCRIDGDRMAMLSKAVNRLTQLRSNPLG